MGQVSEKTDSFAAGVVLLELLIGSNGRVARGLLESLTTERVYPAVTKFLMSGSVEGGFMPVLTVVPNPPNPPWPERTLVQLCALVDLLTRSRCACARVSIAYVCTARPTASLRLHFTHRNQ